MDRCIWIVFSLLYFSSFAEAEAVWPLQRFSVLCISGPWFQQCPGVLEVQASWTESVSLQQGQ
jgi:hypothetical protein